ncbi:CPBP family intramembrane metalloprotease [Verrucomicrobiaceae bacterium N1E253]|uniref:CPBP family intramembrane metalloprotease n=1 Tax=Oceaniferula marina TaxID=2748318 RepID=A0A851GDJ1_9BACT|nr:type II CAAX endopeptidase family protein [Oceaniferula marina]NWK55828.1 CPBP family intramembrane metalloprotease [Oceaniferula marina]
MPLDPTSVLNTTFLLYVGLLIAGILGYRKWHSPPFSTPSNEKGPTRLDHVDLLGIAVLIFYFASTMLAQQLPAAQAADADPAAQAKQITPAILITGMLIQLFPAALAIILLASRHIPLGSYFGLRMAKAYRLLYMAPAAVLISYLFMIGLSATGFESWLEWLFGQPFEPQQTIQLYQESDEIIIRALFIVSVVVIAPVVEEVVFRGYVYTVTKRYTSRIFATLLSAVFFSVVHNFIPGLLPLAFLAILLTIAYEITGSLWAPISIHALFNACTLIIQEIQHHHQ